MIGYDHEFEAETRRSGIREVSHSFAFFLLSKRFPFLHQPTQQASFLIDYCNQCTRTPPTFFAH